MKTQYDLVSDIDVSSERMLHSGLLNLLPESAFFGEETVRERGRSRYLWVVDPLDGTTNFIRGINIWTISVALMDQERCVAAVIHQPATGETFSALRGHGAFRNGTPLPIAAETGMEGALIGTAFPYRSPDSMDAFLGCARDVMKQCLDIRRMGSAALDLAYVAAGILQGFWEIDLQPYDVAAALLLLQETGCLCTDSRGNPYDPFSSRLLIAGNPGVHRKLLAAVSRHYTA